MKESKTAIHTSVDYLYFVILTITLAAGGTAAGSILRDQEVFTALLDSDVFLFYSEIGLGLAPLFFTLLVWRLWLFSRYRPFAPIGDNDLPSITIIIPAYNEGRQVLSTIRSVMASDYPRDKMRVICVDDGSRDDTWQWMTKAAREFPDRVRLVRQPRNMGKRHALLAGFRRARGSSVFVTLDSDSEILGHTLRHLVTPFVCSPRVGAVAGNVRVLNIAGGPIPKMLDVSFTLSFDFLRRGQSVYGGVLCTPGALSAYRASVVVPELGAWADQGFLGRAANIGEDRALSNIVLRQGFRVVYQKNAVVLTTIPETYQGLYRMLLRWARSNVRECLVMAQYLYRGFRRQDQGAGWLRLAGTMELLILPLAETMKVGLLLHLLFHPLITLPVLATGCAMSAALPAVVYQFRRPGLYGCVWALAYCAFWLTCLSWISAWGLFSAGCSGWLTRGMAGARPQLALAVEKRSEAI
jgi:hyaluronan synthase